MKLAEANRRLVEISNNAETGIITPEEAVEQVIQLKEDADLRGFNPSVDPEDYQPSEPEFEDSFESSECYEGEEQESPIVDSSY